jgi:RNA polymerase sigma factor (sigma-70 family)
MQPMTIPTEEPKSARSPAAMRELSRDTAAHLEQVYAAHRDHIYRLGLRYGGNRPAFAEDLTHDVFLKLLKSGSSLEQIEEMGAWLHTAAANLAVSRLRAEKSLLGRFKRLLGRAVRPADARSPQDTLELHESAALATRALASLPPRQRVAVCMKLLDGATQREIAAALAISEASVSRLLARARKRIEAVKAEVGDADLG